MALTERAIAYHEPGIVMILIIAGFVYSLNAIDYALDKLVYCGLVGQIFIGVAFGTPGLQWLPESLEGVVVQLGYLGLLLLVYEGGLSTNLTLLRSNLLLSSAIALTGVAAPIALSFVLEAMLPITSLQAFAAGAALCSTSLGTTFTILQTSGLSKSKLGVVLAGAAMMDDVVGLVLVQIISSLGENPQISAGVVVRPVCVSLAYAIVVPILCLYLIRPMARWLQTKEVSSGLTKLCHTRAFAFWCHTTVLIAFIASASYAGTSNLFAAYLAGASVTWWDALSFDEGEKRQEPAPSTTPANGNDHQISQAINEADDSTPEAAIAQLSLSNEHAQDRQSGTAVFEHYYSAVVNRILRPFFFASIGFSIPIASMFEGSLIWRGIVYTIIMTFAKLICGLWLVRLSFNLPRLPSIRPLAKLVSKAAVHRDKKSPQATPAHTAAAPTQNSTQNRPAAPSKWIEKPQSLYPAALLGSAMVSRGEIGFLISAVAQTSGLYNIESASNQSELFLIVTWAVMLCTIVGPVTTGLLTKRVWRLQHAERSAQSGRLDPLGVWGASQ